MGLFKLGTLLRFTPVAVVIGFTNGIAVQIAVSQVKEFLDLRVAQGLATVGQQVAAWPAVADGTGCACACAARWPVKLYPRGSHYEFFLPHTLPV